MIQRVLSRQRGTRWLSIKAWPSPGHAHALSKRSTPAEEPYTTTVRVFYLLGETKIAAVKLRKIEDPEA